MLNQGIRLSQSVEMRRRFSPLVGISSLELELLLDQSLRNVKSFHEENPDWRNKNPVEERGNYFWQGSFLDGCKSVKGKIPREKHLENPEILVERFADEYSTKYNPQIAQRIAEKLAEFKRTRESERPPAESIFSKRFAIERGWIVDQQVEIVKYLCNIQDSYLQTQISLNLKPINQGDVADHIGYSITSVSRLVKNLTAQLPDGRVIFADELIPGLSTIGRKGIYALEQLRKSPELYGDGNWKVSDTILVPILKERFGINLARRTVSKYRGMLQ